MQRDEIRARQQLVQLDFFNAHLLGFFITKEGVVGHDFHLQTARTVANDATDVACADHTQCLAGQLDTHEFGLFPFAGMC